MRITNKAQVWFMDFVIAMTIFSLVLVLYYTYTTNISKQDTIVREDLISDAKTIASSLTSSGYPFGWNSNNVIRIGLTDSNNKLDSAKFREFTEIGYNRSKRLIGIISDYFVFFTNESGEVQNIEGFCGIGGYGVNTSYDIKAAYYYEGDTAGGESGEDYLKSFMEDTFHATIYCEKASKCSTPLYFDDFIEDIDDYEFIVVEHPYWSTNDFNTFKGVAENWVNAGGTLFLGGEMGSSMPSTGLGAKFRKISGTSDSERTATVVNEDEFVSFNLGEIVIFRQAFYVRPDGGTILKDIARFNGDWEGFDEIKANGDIAVARWPYGDGKVFFFSDFDADYLGGDILEVLQNAAKKWADAQCSPINISNLKRDNLVKVERIVARDSDILKMTAYLWQWE